MRILAGQVVLLTGASGGLGTYMAQAFAERKVKLALVAHPGIDLEGLRKSIADAGAQVIALTCDLRDPAQRRAMLAVARSRLGLINIIANNAGGEVQLGVPRPERGTDWRAAKREPGSANDPQPVGVARNA